MKQFALISVLAVIAALLLVCGMALAQICPTAPSGYIRQLRPQGEPANYPPSTEPACFQRGTNEAANYISCYMCHDRLWRNA